VNAVLEIAKLCGMEKADVRRKNLAKWFSDKERPDAEKSYISQLINGSASFGERAAKRLERDYGMPEGYLDQDEDKKIAAVPRTQQPYNAEPDFDDVMELLNLFQQASPEGRKAILRAANGAAKANNARWKRVVGNGG
jgi:hypothetical protein